MVQKCLFCRNFEVHVLANIAILHIFIHLKSKKKIKSDRHSPYHQKMLAPRVSNIFFDETRYSALAHRFNTHYFGGKMLSNTHWKNISYCVNQKIHLIVFTDQASER